MKKLSSRRLATLVGPLTLLLPLLPYSAEAARTMAIDWKVPHVPGELIVKMKSGQSATLLRNQKLQASSIHHVQSFKVSFGNLAVIKVSDKSSLASVAKELESLPEVDYVEPNYYLSIGAPQVSRVTNPRANFLLNAPNDPRFGQLWGLQNTGNNSPDGAAGTAGADVGALRAWEITKGSRQVKVAVIDTGIDYNHQDLKANLWTNEAEANGRAGVDDDKNGFVDDVHGYDFSNNDGDPLDGHGHGTHCAGTIGAVHDNGVGVAGVMGEVTMVAVKFLSDAGSGTTADAVKAIDYATGLGVDIMSNSWGGGGFSQALQDSIEAANEKGILFVAAAGNSTSDNDASPHYPSNYPVANVISVAAHTNGDGLASFSSYGLRTVHVAAPGHKVLSTVTNNGYAVYSGTSMATPHVSGALGLLLSREAGLSPVEVKERLMGTAEPIRAYRRKTISGGRMNAYNLLTNRRPARTEPDPSLWRPFSLTQKFETEHPYANNSSFAREYTVAGAKFVRAKIKRYDIETGYDFLKVQGKSRAEIESLSGVGANYVTDYVEGNTIRLEFTSDSSVNKWGVLVEELEAIYE